MSIMPNTIDGGGDLSDNAAMAKPKEKTYRAGPMKREPTHPGAIVKSAMEALDVTPYAVAKAIGMTAMALHNVLNCKSSMTAEMALLLEKHLRRGDEHVDAKLLLDLQIDHDLWKARQDPAFARKLAGVKPIDGH